MHAAKPPPGLIFILTFAARCRYRLSISRTALWGRLGSFSSLLRHILTADWPQGAGGPPPASREARRAAQILYSPGVSKAGLPESCSLWLTGEARQTNRQRNPTGEVKNLGIIPAIRHHSSDFSPKASPPDAIPDFFASVSTGRARQSRSPWLPARRPGHTAPWWHCGDSVCHLPGTRERLSNLQQKVPNSRGLQNWKQTSGT